MLSNTLTQLPTAFKNRANLYSGDINHLVNRLSTKGYKHAYVDGGMTITAFLNAKLINEMTITQVPILLGAGLPLFGQLEQPMQLVSSDVKKFANGFIQTHFSVVK